MSAKHIYQREIDANGSDSLAKVARMIRPGSSVLDIGTGTGALGRYLSAFSSCVVDGVNNCVEEVDAAKSSYRTLKLADVESEPIGKLFEGESYDYIVCADLLEHLREPGRLLESLEGLLNPEGSVLISIPNIGYIGAVANLLSGEFRYTEEGLLDSTHLHFFTRKSLIELIESNGFKAVHIDYVTQDIEKSEFRARYLDAWPPAVARFLLSRPDAFIYQFIVQAFPAERCREVSPIVADAPAPELHFSCELYWRYENGEFASSQCVRQQGVIGADHQLIRFNLPSGGLKPPAALRLDVADRPCIFHLYSIQLCDDADEPVWRWSSDYRELRSRNDIIAGPAVRGCGTTIRVFGNEASLLLPVPAETLQRLKGGRLECELSWPMSSDFLALETGMLRDWASLRNEVDRLQEQVKMLENDVNSLTDALTEAQRYVRLRESDVASLADELAKVSHSLASAMELAHQRLDENQQLTAELNNVRAELNNVRTSTSWKITAPLRWVVSNASRCWEAAVSKIGGLVRR